LKTEGGEEDLPVLHLLLEFVPVEEVLGEKGQHLWVGLGAYLDASVLADVFLHFRYVEFGGLYKLVELPA
jgi:hypothetical protein